MHSGTWWTESITLHPGEFHLCFNRNVANVNTTPVSDLNDPANAFRISVYPKPALERSVIRIENSETGRAELRRINEAGQALITKSLG